MDALYTGKQIAQRRKELGLTQKMLAAQLNVTDKAVSKWERGLNFPDLGLMESLAKVLETTPAVLLGLENADQQELVSSLAQLSDQQLEDARNDLKRIGWCCMGVAVLLIAAYMLFGNNVVRTQRAYLILHCCIIAIIICGIYLLVKYKQIRRFATVDTLILYVAAISVLVVLGYQFITGYSPNTILTLCLFSIAAGSSQLLFYRIMEPKLVKALPSIGLTLFTLWHIILGNFVTSFIVPTVCCLIVWLLCMLKKPLR